MSVSMYAFSYNVGTNVEQTWQRNKLNDIVVSYINRYRKRFINILTRYIIHDISRIIFDYVF